jgi:hypothetical protein
VSVRKRAAGATRDDAQMGTGRHRRLAVVGVIAAVLVVPAAAFSWQHQEGAPIPLKLGDIAQVAGARIGCAVRRQDGYAALDCRRIGPLRGSYGAVLTGRKLQVVRFKSQKTAKIVFSAQHERLRVRTCR